MGIFYNISLLHSTNNISYLIITLITNVFEHIIESKR
jgi:hypothetical protein